MKGLAIWTVGAVGGALALLLVICVPTLRGLSCDIGQIKTDLRVALTRVDLQDGRLDSLEKRIGTCEVRR